MRPNNRLRLMVCGRPKTAKTGLLCAALNVGFEVGLLDFDGNSDPLYTFTDPNKLSNLSVISLQDRLSFGQPMGGGKEYAGQGDREPMAFRKAFQAIDNWDKFDPEHQWGPVKSWGTNRILALDSLTSMGDAAFNRVRYINSRNRFTTRDTDFGFAMADQEAMLAKLMSQEYSCHVICFAHLKMIGPKEPRLGKDDDTEMREIKTAIAKANTEIIPTRLYPSAIGRALPENILRLVPASVMTDVINNKRVIVTKPQSDIAFDIGVPGKLPKEHLPVEDGLLTIMKAVTGYDKPY